MGIYTSGNQTWQLKIHHLYIVFPAINLNLVWGFSSQPRLIARGYIQMIFQTCPIMYIVPIISL